MHDTVMSNGNDGEDIARMEELLFQNMIAKQWSMITSEISMHAILWVPNHKSDIINESWLRIFVKILYEFPFTVKKKHSWATSSNSIPSHFYFAL